MRIQAYLGGGADEVTGEAAGHVELVHVRADEAVEATKISCEFKFKHCIMYLHVRVFIINLNKYWYLSEGPEAMD